jgi:hypothetical protein
MKKYGILLLVFFSVTILFNGCEDRSELTAPVVSTGSADFSRFVTIGNSLTAGYQSGSLYQSAQINSFGKLLAKQVGTSFEVPYVADPGTPGRIEVASLSPFATKTNTAQGALLNSSLARPYNNLGIPGATLYDVLNATNQDDCFQKIFGGTPNPMFDLVLRNSGLNIGSQFKQAKALSPTFISLWIGNNDILGYATSGGTVPFTPLANFTGLYNQLADSIASLGAKVVVANIPNVIGIPFFTTVGGQLKLQGYSKVWAVDASGNTVYMDLNNNNFLTLKASGEMYDASGNPTGKGFYPHLPLSNAVVLDSGEVVQTMTLIAQYNAVIAAAAQSKGWAYVDVYKLFTDIIGLTAQGKKYVVNGINFDAIYVTGNLFSMDGVHPTSQGQGIVANLFIEAINSTFNASIPLINVANIPGSLIFGKTVRYDKMGIPLFVPGSLDGILF